MNLRAIPGNRHSSMNGIFKIGTISLVLILTSQLAFSQTRPLSTVDDVSSSLVVFYAFEGNENISGGEGLSEPDAVFQQSDLASVVYDSESVNEGFDRKSSDRGAYFTGSYSDYGRDPDGDGIFNTLSIDCELSVLYSGDYAVTGALSFDDTLITKRSNRNHAVSMPIFLTLEPGLDTVTVDFSGEDIYDSGFDGNYSALFSLLELDFFDGIAETIDTIFISTNSYNHLNFGEISSRIVASLDYGQDINSNNLYDYLIAKISLQTTIPSICSLEGVLASDSIAIAFAEEQAYLNAGVDSLELRFEGSEIRESELNGPYDLIITLSDENHSAIGSKIVSTASYSYVDFEKAPVCFDNIYDDYGTDLDTNGLFDFLTLEVCLDVKVAGDYKITGWLKDSARLDICYTNTSTYLGVGSQTATLNFNGTKIRKHGVDGPYQVSHIAIHNKNNTLINNKMDAHTTSEYGYSQFE